METIHRLFKTATIFVVLATPFAAQAQQFATREITVRAYDLDLSQPADADTLLSRVRQAAKHACARIDDTRNMSASRERAECIKTSYRNTLAAINSSSGIDVEAIAAAGSQARKVANTRK